VPAAACADLQPPGIAIAGPGAALRFGDEEGRGAMPSKLLPPLPASLACPAWRETAAMALARGGNVKALLSAGLEPGRPALVGLNEAPPLAPRAGLALPTEVGRPLSRVLEQDADACTRLLFDLQTEAPRDDVLPKSNRPQDAGPRRTPSPRPARGKTRHGPHASGGAGDDRPCHASGPRV
jgi:hypothetical protein